ncbi:MAG: ABC transporter ATP-binding protein [Anaerolineae bacterium]|nr:ABC transporter ATP-binding protein [Anaerolineae bacterium]
MLHIRDLVVNYGPVEVLHGISLNVDKGEIVAVLGPNGAGKSTLLRTVVGLLRPQRGEIIHQSMRIDGRSPEDNLATGIALVPEGRRIFSRLTVLENLRAGAYLQRNKRAVEESLAFVFEQFPILAERQAQLGGTLSGGQQQMLAIARALMSQPKMMLLDEPSLGLAPLLVSDILELIQHLRDDGLTIVLVEQNAHQALEISDRAYVLASGRVQAAGSAQEFQEGGLDLERAYLGDA